MTTDAEIRKILEQTKNPSTATYDRLPTGTVSQFEQEFRDRLAREQIARQNAVKRGVSSWIPEIPGMLADLAVDVPYNIAQRAAGRRGENIKPLGFGEDVRRGVSQALGMAPASLGEAGMAMPPDETNEAVTTGLQLANPLMWVSAGNPAAIARAAGKGAKALGPTAANLMEDYMMKAGLMPSVVKPKGGNWLPEGTKALEGLKTENRFGTKDPQEYMDELRAKYNPEALSRMSPGVQQEVKVTIQELGRKIALNQWIDKQLTRYVKNEMATPEDPIRATAETGRLHFDAPQVNPSDLLDMKRQEFAAGNNEKWGYGTSRLAQNWEDAADKIINKIPAGRYQEQGSGKFDINRFDMTKQPGWEFLDKVSPETPLYGINNPSARSNVSIESLGFPHLIDELRNATNPASGLPRELLLKSESLSKLSVPQAVERVAKINEWRAAQMETARKAAREGIPVHKEFPDGYKWMASPDTVADAKALQYIQDVGCEGGWCTGSEELAKRYGGEGNQLYVLHDPSGKAVTQISVKPNSMYSDLRALNDERLIDPSKLSQEEFSKLYADMRKRGLASSALGDQASVVRSGLVAHPDYPNWISPKDNFSEAKKSIVEIKGKQNRAPSEEYLPYVQDFVRSGKWSDVGDLRNTGLIKTHKGIGGWHDISPEMSGNARQLAYGRASAAGEIQPYMTMAELEAAMKKHAPEDIWSRPGQPMTEADLTDPFEPEGMKRGGPVSQDAMQMAVWGKSAPRKQVGGIIKGASNMAKLMRKLNAEAPVQAQQIRKALGQAFTTGNEHSVVGPTHSAPNEPGRVGRITTQGKDFAVAPNQLDILNAVRGKSSIVDFHSHPSDSGRAFAISPSSEDFHFAANQYFPGRESRELRTFIASPADAELRMPTEYSFFATNNPGKAFDRRAREAAVYELQRGGKNIFKDVFDDPRFRDYFEHGGNIGDWAEDVAPLALLKLRELQALGRGELQLSGKPLAASGGTNIELYEMMQPAATEFLRGKKFDEGGVVAKKASGGFTSDDLILEERKL